MRVRDVSTLVILLLCPLLSVAQEACYRYGVTYTPISLVIEAVAGGHTSEESVGAAAATLACELRPDWSNCRVGGFFGDYPSRSVRIEYTVTANGFENFVGATMERAGPLPEYCPPPPSCSDYENRFGSDRYLRTGSSSGEFPGEECHKPSGCLATRTNVTCVAGEGCLASYSFGLRRQCEGSESQAEADVNPGEGEACVGPYCSSDTGGNCGFLNDSYVCLGSINPDSCHATSDGGRVCGGDAQTPPVPDDGTPGVPADPSIQITINDNSTVNYFDSDTVGASSRPTGDAPPGPTPGGSGTGTGAGAGGNSGLVCNPAMDKECGAGGSGDGSGNGSGDEEEGLLDGVPCYAEGEGFTEALAACGSSLWEGMFTSLEASDFLQLVLALPDSVPENTSCPMYTFSAFGDTYDFMEGPCMLIEQQRSLLSLLFMIMYSFIGLRILMSIPGGGE